MENTIQKFEQDLNEVVVAIDKNIGDVSEQNTVIKIEETVIKCRDIIEKYKKEFSITGDEIRLYIEKELALYYKYWGDLGMELYLNADKERKILNSKYDNKNNNEYNRAWLELNDRLHESSEKERVALNDKYKEVFSIQNRFEKVKKNAFAILNSFDVIIDSLKKKD